MRKSNYDKFPVVMVPQGEDACALGWDAIAERLRQAVAARGGRKTILAVECYPGVDEAVVLGELTARLAPTLSLPTRPAFLPPAQIDALVEPFLGGDDPVFGFLSGLKLPQFFDAATLQGHRSEVERAPSGLVLIVGCGAALIHPGDLLVYADLARWEAQLRFRRNETSNLGVENRTLSAALQYKRAFFVDWRVCDRWKRPLIERWDFVLDTNTPTEPKLAAGEAVRRGLRHAAARPFRVAPFFDPAPWGGQWMKWCATLTRARRITAGALIVCPRRTACCSGLAPCAWSCPRSTWCFTNPGLCWATPSTRVSAMNSRSGSICWTPWAVGISPSKSIL